MIKFIVSLIVLVFISACGGGGGGGGGGAPVPQPSANISASDTEVSVNDSITLSWSSSNTSSCTASGSWTGTKTVSGSEVVSLSSAGTSTFTITCSDSSNKSALSSVTVNVGYPISIGNLYNSDSNSGVELFLDFNDNLFKDTNEPAFTSSSSGNFEYRSTNQDEANCLKRFSTVSSDGLLFSPNLNQEGNSNINPFTSIFSDFADNSYLLIIDNEGSDKCNILNLYMNKRVNYYNNFDAMKRVEIFDGFVFADLEKETIVDTQRMADLVKFQKASKSISDTIKSDFQDLANAVGLDNITIFASSELDTSNFRIFLNTSSYPNPSTDLQPTASSIDSVAAQVGIKIKTVIPDYIGSWTNYGFYDTDNLKISNNGDLLSNQTSCYINFSSLCKQATNINNLISYGSFSLTDLYQKVTTRGEETIENQQYIIDNSTLRCREYDKQSISNESEDRHTVVTFSEYRGESYFLPDDFDCNTYDANGRGFVYQEFFPDGTSYYMELWDSAQVLYDNNEFFIDDYDTDNPFPEQLPQSTVDIMATLESLYTNSSGSGMLSATPNPFNILVAIINGTFPALGAPQLSYYVQSTNNSGRISSFYMALDSLSFDCQSPDENISSTLYSSEGISDLNDCIEMLDKDKVFETVRNIRNKSPYQGYINE